MPLVLPFTWVSSMADVQANFEAIQADDTGWQPITTFTNSWAADSANPVSYRASGIWCAMRGAIAGGTANTTAFTLPSSVAPATVWVAPVQEFDGTVDNWVAIQPTGEVQPANATGAWLTIVFPIG